MSMIQPSERCDTAFLIEDKITIVILSSIRNAVSHLSLGCIILIFKWWLSSFS